MARKTKEEAEATKEAILEAAAKVFVDKGVAKASLEEIASEAGVTRGAVYWHFKNKCDIFAALHDQLYVTFSEMILQGLEKGCPHPLHQLKSLCVDLLLDLERNQQKKRVLTIFFLRCDYSGEMQCFLEYQQEQRKKSMELFSRFFKRAIEKGYLPKDSDPCLLTHSLVCYITGIAFEYLRYPKLIDLEKSSSVLMDQYFQNMGLCKKE